MGGGLGRAAEALHEAMLHDGVDSRIVATGSEVFTRKDLKIYKRTPPSRFFFSPAMLMAAQKLVGQANFVHGHGFYVAPNWIIGSQCRLSKKVLVYHPHGMFEPWILARSRLKKKIAHLFYENANFKYAKLWRALTSREADQIRAQGITRKVIVAPNGIHLGAFDSIDSFRREAGGSKNSKTILYLGRIHPKKGLPLLFEAWSSIPEYSRKEWNIVIAGPDELNHRSELESIVDTLGLRKSVVFIGLVEASSKMKCLAEADAFVLPSYSEGFSVAVLEGMASRLPVIATHACNFPELEIDGGGWCVDSTVEGIRGALTALLSSDSRELIDRGEAARALIEQSYTWENISRKIDDACSEFRI